MTTVEDDPFERLFPPNSIVHVHVEVARIKKIFQHEDNARATSCFVEALFSNSSDVCAGWLEPGDTAAAAEKEIAQTPRRGKHVDPPNFSDAAPGTAADAGVQFQTKIVSETADPFINDGAEFFFTPTANVSSPDLAVARFNLRVVDNNFEPARPVARATLEFNFSKNAKGELTLAMPLDPQLAEMASATEAVDRASLTEAIADEKWPSFDLCKEGDPVGGSMVIRWNVRVTKPKPPVRDPEADIEVPMPEKLSGATLLVNMPVAPKQQDDDAAAAAPEPPGPHAMLPGVVLFCDQDFTTKLNKAMIKILGAVHDEELAAKSPSRRRGGGGFGGSQARRGAQPTAGEEETTIDKVVLQYWKCKRSHQVMTKMRIAAEHCLKGDGHLGFTPEEELEKKTLWKKNAALLHVGVTAPQLGNVSSALKLIYDKLWVMTVTGDDETESGSLWTPNIDQRTKLQYVAWGPTQYVALQAAFVKLVLPTLSDQEALNIGLEDLKADDVTLEAMTPAPGSSRVVGQNPNVAPPSPSASPAASRRGGAPPADTPYQAALKELERTYAPARSDAAFRVFARQMSEFTHRWAGTMTETEQITLIKATSHVMPFARFHAGLITEKPRASRRSASRRGASRR